MTVGQLLDQHVPDKDSLAVCRDSRLLGVSPDEGAAEALMTSKSGSAMPKHCARYSTAANVTFSKCWPEAGGEYII